MGFDVSEIANAGARTLLQLDVVAHNLANVTTPGFKASHLFYAMKEQQASDNQSSNSILPNQGVLNYQGALVMDLGQGIIEKTGNMLDMAIEGEGFFTIQQKEGNSYTRNGSFIVNKSKELVTKTGAKVLGESGPITINGTSINVGQDGSIIVDGSVAAKLKIVAFKKPGDLTRASEGQFIDEGKAGIMKAETFKVAGGFLEASNVNAIKEMVEMIDMQRSAFETYSKIIQTMADFDKISTSKIGRLV